MQRTTLNQAGIIALGAMIAFSTQATAQQAATQTPSHTHTHKAEGPSLINAAEIQARPLSDWAADWQSIHPYLNDGTLDAVMTHKAENGEKTVEEYHAYYQAGYKTDVERILINGSTVTFFRDGTPIQGEYEDDGYEILTYESGNQGVRFLFKKSGGDVEAPASIQFSDHKIVPTKADHYHLYWGNDRAQILTEWTNWPTYFPIEMSGEDIANEMLAH
ncbi:ZinT/AdcA family metal-binding protein [Parasedimentitalea maritima]|uniref:ZinT/AdcA family metal-binding protein n=1 Tax=Parasedimentitalea maritima TaxID=2578117 RepID=A0A6A4RAM5_9RHOB|nr:ZinT/AdcA family metal-binding protein [Zongyanglinia marina]KAE9624752.1 ZinT/AdcA family metal-binding protein [Zongyanglinia marina]